MSIEVVMNMVLCPHCNAKIRHDGSHAGQVVSCPRCRGQLQLPCSPQVAPDNSPFEDINEDSGYRRRRRQQPSHAGLWTLAVFSLLGIGFIGLWWSGVVQFKLPRQEAAKEAKNVRASEAASKPKPEKDQPRTPQGEQGTISGGEQEKKERELAEAARKKAAEQALRQNEIDRLLAELDQQAKKDIAEIDQRLISYRRLAAIWEQKAAALRQNPRFGDPFNAGANAALRSLNQESAALQGDLRSISRLIDQKQQAFNQKRDAIFRQFPDATLPTWTNYYGASR
jgi:hypothetical protein